ncbi:hypothetical protein [Enterococcus durans]|uniref:hypothetical protein n=1 Tax=Enterococcus durans TaxID=53345 RepID=UPI001C8B387A|nr:hypothetical protein [Enterococcus durans]MBX9040718.1 hypothetical protein [Enterococcus durans]MBX9077406.1 hypothetical protein [Enterococcus durans]
MIYIGKVRPSIMEPPIDKSIIQFFSEYTPIKVVVPDDPEEQKQLKGAEFVRDGLKYELEQLQLMEMSE